MTDTIKTELAGQPPSGGPHAMLRGLLAVVALVVLALVGVFGWQWYNGVKSVQGSGQVAMLDQATIWALPEFTQVKKDLDDKARSLQDKANQMIKAHKGATTAEISSMQLQMRQQLEQMQARELKPLEDRVHNAIAALAAERGYKVVLDKKIVVTGVVDITDDVKKRFEENKDQQPPKEVADNNSHIGYVNQDAVADLTMYKEANAQFLAYYQDLIKQFIKATAKKPQAAKEQMRSEMAKALQAKQDEIFKPVNDRVTNAITEVAREKGLSLVLNSTHVMWGGRNLTDDVIKKLVSSEKG